jgi:hypothetical protein
LKSLYDQNRREIMVGDLVKVFHFVGARRKRHYMYKHVVRETQTTCGLRILVLSHLDNTEGNYKLICDDAVMCGYEIVQSADARFEQRPRLTA